MMTRAHFPSTPGKELIQHVVTKEPSPPHPPGKPCYIAACRAVFCPFFFLFMIRNYLPSLPYCYSPFFEHVDGRGCRTLNMNNFGPF